MDAPDTVSEAVAYLADLGYVDDLKLCPEGLVEASSGDVHPLATAHVDHELRFEGPTDPADEAIVLGVHCTDWDRKGVVVSGYGPNADPDEADLLIALTKPRG
jgi:hypothetical protein